MIHYGLDLASGPDMTTLTFSRDYPIFVGDRVALPGQTNKHRTVVVRRFAGNHVEIKTFVRPSRGFARHIRRKKSVG